MKDSGAPAGARALAENHTWEQTWEHRHATDGGWCNGRFPSIPVRFVGLGHPASRNGWPVYRCLECGDEIFIDALMPHQPATAPKPSPQKAPAQGSEAGSA